MYLNHIVFAINDWGATCVTSCSPPFAITPQRALVAHQAEVVFSLLEQEECTIDELEHEKPRPLNAHGDTILWGRMIPYKKQLLRRVFRFPASIAVDSKCNSRTRETASSLSLVWRRYTSF